jgi:hemolysin activation/secretion protein
VGRVRVSGAQHHDEANVRRSLPALADGMVPDLDALDAQLQLANDAPVKRTTVVAVPGMDQTVDFDVRVEYVRAWRIATSLDNTGTEETGELRFGIGAQHANLWNRDHVLSFQYVTAPHQDDDPDRLALPIEDDVRIFGASYRIPVPRARAAVEIYGGSANVDSGVVAGVFDITGSGSVLGGRFAFVLPAAGAWEQRLTAGYERRKYDNDVEVAGGSESLTPDYTVSPLSLDYSVQARLAGATGTARLAVARNLPHGANSSEAAFEAIRIDASNEYTLARLSSRVHVPLGAYGDLALRVDAQYTADLLVPGEQFGIGGINSVRGLEERQFIADRGVSGSVEWLLPNPFERSSRARSRLLIFLDGGYGQTLDATPFELASIDVASTGIGVRIGNGRNLAFSLDYGHLIDPDSDLDVASSHWHGSFTWFF